MSHKHVYAMVPIHPDSMLQSPGGDTARLAHRFQRSVARHPRMRLELQPGSRLGSGMTRTAITLAVMLALIAVLAAICGSSAHTPLAYTPLTSGFETLGVPGSSELSPVQGDRKPGLATPLGSLGGQGVATPPSTSQPAPSATRRPKASIGTAVGAVKGSASFYAYVPGGAAAAARLRDAIGSNWRGRRVTVWYGSRHVVVTLSDFESSLIPGRLIDLDEASFAALVGPGWYQRGRVSVEVDF